jgi:hypothetical protein
MDGWRLRIKCIKQDIINAFRSKREKTAGGWRKMENNELLNLRPQ